MYFATDRRDALLCRGSSNYLLLSMLLHLPFSENKYMRLATLKVLVAYHAYVHTYVIILYSADLLVLLSCTCT